MASRILGQADSRKDRATTHAELIVASVFEKDYGRIRELFSSIRFSVQSISDS